MRWQIDTIQHAVQRMMEHMAMLHVGTYENEKEWPPSDGGAFTIVNADD
jgi:hypothetical protein